MIKDIIDLLNTADYYGVSENVDIAKGRYALPHSWKDAFSKIKRHSKSKREPLTWKAVLKKMIK
jgi:hypothetical protein